MMQTKLQQAQLICERNGGKLTSIRKQILQFIYEANIPISAYELLSCLRKTQANAQPPTIYRALDFLQRFGLIHRIEKDNRFFACEFPTLAHSGFFFICSKCQNAMEINNPQLASVITQAAQASRFEIEEYSVEIRGSCEACQRSKQRCK